MIVEIDGTAISSGTEFNRYVSENPISDKTVHIVAKRGDETIEKDVQPVLGIKSYETGFSYNTGRVKGSALQVIKYSLVEVKYQVKMVFKSLGMLFTGQLGVNDFTGPVGIVDAIDSVFLNLVNFTILLSANLGIMNLLPIPGLDGGRLLFLLIEAVRGKPVKHEEYINLAGMLLIMVFAMYILFKDIINLF